MRVADFFCGGGGFSEGFRQAGFAIVFAVDRWEPAVKTYKGNKPGVNVVKDDVIRISQLSDDEFEKLVPDSEVIIGSPPCQSFSHSNKSGNADKSLGIQLIEAYLRIIARKKFKKDSILKYWVLENVPNVENYIKKQYSAADLGLEGDFILHTQGGASGKYNAKYFGAPTNRERYLCGEFPEPRKTKTDDTLVTLNDVLKSFGEPLSDTPYEVADVNYPDLILNRGEITDFQYIYELAPFEWETAKRLKQDKGYMGKMSFPENLNKPARTVMATMASSSREAMILSYGNEKYRLPTVREVASMMSFPIDYWFYGSSKATKHTLVGNAVPPKMSYAIAKAIAEAEGKKIPNGYIPINHDNKVQFINLNGNSYPLKQERRRRDIAKFKYHIPYMIINRYRVELTNYHSDFRNNHNDSTFIWNVEIHYSQGKDKAKIFCPEIPYSLINSRYTKSIKRFVKEKSKNLSSFADFQLRYCMTTQERLTGGFIGPYELLGEVKKFIESTILGGDSETINLTQEGIQIPLKTAVGYIILKDLINKMGGIN